MMSAPQPGNPTGDLAHGLVSVIICTAAADERREMLRDAVQSVLVSNQISKRPWELLVVDNSRDGRLEPWLVSLQQSWPEMAIRWIPEPEPGISRARNRGVAEARGGYFCFVDDDVLVPPGWMDHMVEALSLAPGAGCIAGRIELRFEQEPLPKWLDPMFYGYYSQFDKGALSGVMTRDIEFYGANFLITRGTAQRIGDFSLMLGRVGTSLLSGEDTEYARRITAAGIPIVYSSEGYLVHRVPASRLRFRWMLQRAFLGALSHASIMDPVDRREMHPKLFLKLLSLILEIAWALPTAAFSPRRAARKMLRFSHLMGIWRCPAT